jgi:hypothetical protein
LRIGNILDIDVIGRKIIAQTVPADKNGPATGRSELLEGKQGKLFPAVLQNSLEGFVGKGMDLLFAMLHGCPPSVR